MKTEAEQDFDRMAEVARKIMQDATRDCALILGEAPPLLIEKRLPDGSIRIICRWADGAETNECLIQRKKP